MAKNNQITKGRLQILLYLVDCVEWVLPKEVLNNAKPDHITSPHGVRKALGELECVELVNVTPTGRPNYQCRLKQDTDTFTELLDIFIGTEHLEDFLHSSYVDNIELRDLEKIDQIVIDTIINKLKTVQLVCDTFYFGLPLTNELNAILASDGVAAKLSSQRRQQISDVVLNLYRRTNRSRLTVGRFMSDLRILLEQTVSSAERS